MTKDTHMFDWVWRALKDTVSSNDGYPVSAGQVAKTMQVSRNTAEKYLEKLIITGEAARVTWQHGRVQTRVYNITPRRGE
jgi:response regulator of citrate/malate metabolism